MTTSNMKLIGREEQITRLENYIQGNMGGNLVVHGEVGHGKTFLIRSWLREQSPSKQILGIYYSLRSDFEPAQYFLKQWIQQIANQLPSEIYNQWQLNLKERSRLPQSSTEWVNQVGNRYQVDGYIFLLKMKSLLKIYPGKVVLCLDQCEIMSAEGKELLRLICEWKPERMFVILGVQTRLSGKEAIQSDFGVQFFFKGNQYLEINHISPFLKHSYQTLYGIKSDFNDNNFMLGAGKQQREWINQRCSECAETLEILAFLSFFPSGIPHDFNPMCQKLETLMDREPLLKFIIDSNNGMARIEDLSLITDLESAHPNIFQSLQMQCLDLGNQFLDPHALLELQLKVSGQPSSECLQSLLTEYESTRSLNLLLELCDAMSDVKWDSEELSSRLAWNLSILDLLVNYDTSKADILIKSLPPALTKQWELLLEVLWQFGAENLWLQHLEEMDSLSVYGSLVLQVLLKKSLKENLSPLQIEEMFTGHKVAELQNLFALLGFLDGHEKPNNWNQVLVALPEMAHYAEAGFELQNNKIQESLKHLDLAIESSLQNGNLHYLPMLLTLLSECYGGLEDFDNQLFFYREAVIAQQFLSNGV